ncbi:MAG: hypothetical protein U1E39_13685 [Planctomycetota bacterium]
MLRSAVLCLALAAATSAAVSSPSVEVEAPLLVVDVSESMNGAADALGDAATERLLVADGARLAWPGEAGVTLPRGRTRLATGLRAALEHLAGGTRDVWLVTDGRSTEGGVADAAHALAAQGHAVHVGPPPAPSADVGLDLVRVVAAGDDGVTVRARVVASVTGRARAWRCAVPARRWTRARCPWSPARTSRWSCATARRSPRPPRSRSRSSRSTARPTTTPATTGCRCSCARPRR